MYIRELRIRNFMIHSDTSLRLHPLTVFVGPNGAGKSALFDAILNFSMVSRGNLREAFGPYPYSFRATIHRAASNVARISYRVTMAKSNDDPDSLLYEIDYAQVGSGEGTPRFTIPHEKLTRSSDGHVLFDRADPDAYQIATHIRLEDDRSLFAAIRQADLSGNVPPNIDPLVSYCAKQISRVNKFRLDPLILAQPSRLPDPSREIAPRLGYHGEDLAATLYHLKETADPALETIRKRVKAIEPAFDDFEFTTVGTERIAFALKYSDARESVPSVRVSSGTLIYLGLIALVTIPNRPPLLMIEEAENGLTPQAIKSFYGAVRSLALSDEQERRSQVLLSSHSPFVICEAWNGEDREFINQVRIVGGRAQVRTFADVIGTEGIQLRKNAEGDRTQLGLQTAVDIMSGHFA